jgi:3-isopropylmalate dehydratase small subunit
MNPVSTTQGKACPFGLKNVDADFIIPASSCECWYIPLTYPACKAIKIQ